MRDKLEELVKILTQRKKQGSGGKDCERKSNQGPEGTFGRDCFPQEKLTVNEWRGRKWILLPELPYLPRYPEGAEDTEEEEGGKFKPCFIEPYRRVSFQL